MPAYGIQPAGGVYGSGGMVRAGAYNLGALGQPAQGGQPMPTAGMQLSGGGGYGSGGMLNQSGGGQYSVIGQSGFYDPAAGMGDAQNSAIGATNQFLPGIGSGQSMSNTNSSLNGNLSQSGSRNLPVRTGPIRWWQPGYNHYNPMANYTNLGPISTGTDMRPMGQNMNVPGAQAAMQRLAQLQSQAATAGGTGDGGGMLRSKFY